MDTLPPPQPSRPRIPGMRPARRKGAAHSATPIYDELYARYRRQARTVPGERGAEDRAAKPAAEAE
ncbi:hypothetical protein ACFQLX_13740 [Streptomyces polyrhachis]|uniref:Uncharacterized protein n=1 Tax=Streptomyces polyrhachis TaxID=1282885 RepID=A0ABW2GH03_9ACTN